MKKLKKSKINIFVVTPISKGMTAPSIYTDASSEKGALKEARSRSGLSRFVEWNFYAAKI